MLEQNLVIDWSSVVRSSSGSSPACARCNLIVHEELIHFQPIGVVTVRPIVVSDIVTEMWELQVADVVVEPQCADARHVGLKHQHENGTRQLQMVGKVLQDTASRTRQVRLIERRPPTWQLTHPTSMIDASLDVTH